MLGRFRHIQQRYETLLAEVDREIQSLLDVVDVEHLSRHNAGLRKYGQDKFKWFIEFEKGRFFNALDIIVNSGVSGAVCDLGCLFPYLPLAMSRLGFRVKIVDKYDLYGPQFMRSVEKVAGDNGLELFNLDVVHDDLSCLGKNGVVTLMAVVEHLNGSPRHLLHGVRNLLAPDGVLLFEVPNIATLHKRVMFLLGHSPLDDYASYFASDYPYLGHNREMTVAEVKYLMHASGFVLERLQCYDYSFGKKRTIRRVLAHIVRYAIPIRYGGAVITATARLRLNAQGTTVPGGPSQ